MNIDYWKDMAALWNQRKNIEEMIAAREKGAALGRELNGISTVYRDDDFLNDIDDDEDWF